ncbi:hypothetical protein BDN72DRAFT_785421 [Pluteus cervinus]|uniref:Uncharacterized protein n=1 Tax=Pluteus cervinus TaxID=181527 RepID=A0ACD3BFN7_9AGAR|nr:hypothetical protein BDN72DRAFT_785421 [Pluteus cervinus]
MSRMTSAQVITLGEYLEDGFDPTKLTVSQLLGVLNYHNITYPTPYSKTKLVQLFNEELKPRASKYKKERLKRENSLASDDGITDGVTGQPLNGNRLPPVRRSSRRLSHAPAEEEPPAAAEPPKRRRSSAQPALGAPSRSVAPAQPTLVEESEPEEVPLRKVSRSKKGSDAAETSSRRVSNNIFSEDSGWEDNNIFQSGAESSSPIRPAQSKVSRKSTAPRKSRKSMSAPPQLPLSSPTSPDVTRYPPPQSRFEPKLPAIVTHENQKIMHSPVSPEFSPKSEHDDDSRLLSSQFSVIEEEETQPAEDSQWEATLKPDEEHVLTTVDRVPSDQGSRVVDTWQPPESHRWPIWLRMLTLFIALTATTTVLNYKRESASIGFCNRGSNSNSALETLRSYRLAVDACNRENRTTLYPIGSDESPNGNLPCPPPHLPLPQPDECTPCPGHGTCSQYSVSCDNGYILRSHPLLFLLPAPTFPLNGSASSSSNPSEMVWRAISILADGMPGLGSVAFPPKCVEDPKRKRNIGVLGKAVEAMLGQERGRRICAGGKFLDQVVDDRDGGEAKKWGVEVENLRDVMRKKTAPHLLATFDDTFNEAIQQLIQWGGVVIGEDQDGNRFLAHKTPDLTWNCALTVKTREIWAEWRSTVIGIITVILSIFVARARRAQKQVEARRVAELVQIALDALRNQELAHHTDPITAPHPYLSSLQLRDLILQEEHSVSKRQRLWNAVERVVEGNANVRANMEETLSGDELRVWRWVGSARKPALRQQAVQSDGGTLGARGESD